MDDEEENGRYKSKGKLHSNPISPLKESMFKVVPRKSKLQKSNYLIEPNKLMKSLHTKTHFKAATSVARGDICCLNFRKTEFNDQFAEMARNLNHFNDNQSNIFSAD